MKTVRTERREPAPEPSGDPRRACILDAAFAVLMERGYAGASTLEIAKRAKVSKRELYAVFGSKQGILTALIAARAQRMRMPLAMPTPRDRNELRSALTRFGAALVLEVCHPTVTAIFRLAVAEAEGSPEVGKVLDDVGRIAMRRAFARMLEEAQRAGILGSGEPFAMAEQFFSLLWGDLRIGLLLGVDPIPSAAEAKRRAAGAAEGFLALHQIREM